MTTIDERDFVQVRGILSDLVQDYHGSQQAFDAAYRIVESFLLRSTAYTRSKLTLPILEGICREAAHRYPLAPNTPPLPRPEAKASFPFPWFSTW